MSKKSTKLSDYTPNSDKKEKAIQALQDVFQNMNNVLGIVRASLLNTPIFYQTEKVFKTVNLLVFETNKRGLDLNEVKSMTLSTVELSKSITKAKATNPLISEDLIIAITKTTSEANRALKITEEALK
jgi:hypothetical protein